MLAMSSLSRGLLLFLKKVDPTPVKLVLAVMIIGFAIYNLARPRLFALKDEKPAFLFGLLAGVVGGAYNTNGPIVVMYGTMRKWPPADFRATLQGYFLPTGLMIILGHAAAGLWTPPVLRLYLLVLPLAFGAFLLGSKLNRTVPVGKFDRYVYIFLILAGLILIWQTLWQ